MYQIRIEGRLGLVFQGSLRRANRNQRRCLQEYGVYQDKDEARRDMQACYELGFVHRTERASIVTTTKM